jgi:uncharacterized protein (DUF1330 family)
MVAYVIVIREKTVNPSEGEAYTPKARAASAGHPLTIRAYHGRHEVREGPPIEALAILEFPTFESAQAWYNSPEYQAALVHRLRAGEYRCVIVQGV